MANDRPVDTLPLPSSDTSRPNRSNRAPPASEHADDGTAAATQELASITLNSVTHPVSTGLPSPLRQRPSEIWSPPMRPSSTPFPYPDRASATALGLSHHPSSSTTTPPHDANHDDDHKDNTIDDDNPETCVPVVGDLSGPRGLSLTANGSETEPSRRATLTDLPIEIHENIFDYIFGPKVSPASKASLHSHGASRSWNTVLRHPRRKEMIDLALVCRPWRFLVQERIYRHIKLRATPAALQNSMVHLAAHHTLRSYIKHVEVWFPAFDNCQDRPSSVAPGSLAVREERGPPLPSKGDFDPDTCSLDDIFYLVSTTMPDTVVLTLQGGDRRKCLPVLHAFRRPFSPDDDDNGTLSLPKVPSVRTLICRGQLNLIPSLADFDAIARALPNLVEWQGAYGQAKAKVYLSLSEILPRVPARLSVTNLVLESDYRRENSFPPFWWAVMEKDHLCLNMAVTVPTLEHFAYTGRICPAFFDTMAYLARSRPPSRLKTLNITLKNTCTRRETSTVEYHEGAGIHQKAFIVAFENLVLSAIRALAQLRTVRFLRIRYIDLETPSMILNPFFLVRDGNCYGLWSDAIIAALEKYRPDLRLPVLAELRSQSDYGFDWAVKYGRSKPPSVKIDYYYKLQTGTAPDS